MSSTRALIGQTAKRPSTLRASRDPDTATLAVGSSQPFHATCVWTDNSTSDVTDLATWSTSDDAIATVDAHGLASGVTPGFATISAVFGMVPGSAELTVVP